MTPDGNVKTQKALVFINRDICEHICTYTMYMEVANESSITKKSASIVKWYVDNVLVEKVIWPFYFGRRCTSKEGSPVHTENDRF